jgi:uncharacterized protein (TIGR02246 family)
MTSFNPTVSNADLRALRDVVARAAAAQNDPDTLPELHTSDAVVVNIAGRRVLGKKAFASAMADALSSPLRSVRTSVDVFDVRLPGPDVAVVSCLKTVHDERTEADRTALPAVGALTYVMTRSGDGWLIALAQTTPVVS